MLQFFWALLIMALVGNMIATSYAGDPSIVNYAMFVAVFSMLSLLYLIPATLKDGLGIPAVMIALDVFNTLFYFCAAVALAAYLGVHSCSNNVSWPVLLQLANTANASCSTTQAPTSSLTALATRGNAAVKHRPPPPSCGSASPALPRQRSSRSSRTAEASTCVACVAVLRP